MKVKVYNLIILDESGSMESIHKPAVDGLNETLQTIQSAQKKHGELQEHVVTMVFFNSNGIRPVMENKPIDGVALLKMNDFVPNACTPLYDAMGISLSKLKCQLDKDETNQVLVTIITDGMENASREYSGKMIKNLVRELRDAGWVFAYIGANQDVDAVAESLSINNRMSFSADEEGSRKMYEEEKAYRTVFYNKVGRTDKSKLQEDFFGTKKEGKPSSNKQQ